jgi:CheY-like chemotaxis protein
MNPFKRLTDEQLIQRIRKMQRYRRPLGLLLLFLGLVCAAIAIYYAYTLSAQSLAITQELSQSPHPTTRQVTNAFNNFDFLMSFSLGFGIASLWFYAVVCIAVGFIWLTINNRKDRLLLQHWDAHPPIPKPKQHTLASSNTNLIIPKEPPMPPAKRILNVGQCRIDGPRLTSFLTTEFSPTVDAAATKDEALALAAQHPYDLCLINRLLDRDRTLGTDVIAALRAAHPTLPLMLVSDRPTAQSEAVALGALQGFGKSALDSPETEQILRNILAPGK